MDKTRIAMNETLIPETESKEDDALVRRLLSRIAVAAVVVVGLLGSLAMFDVIYAPKPPLATKSAALPPKSEAPAVTEPAKEEPVATAEAKPAESAATPVTGAKPESVVVAKTEEKAVPERTASPGAPPLQPLPAEKPLTRPATSRPASIRPSEPVPPAAASTARPEPARELAHLPTAPQRAPASRPITQAGERQLALQMGVFSNVANAEDLRAKLELHGIPSSIEARVHAGPFKTREEVEVARAKLKELGLDGGLLVTLKK
jgi:DedD protein